jgi:hypothetical protein
MDSFTAAHISSIPTIRGIGIVKTCMEISTPKILNYSISRLMKPKSWRRKTLEITINLDPVSFEWGNELEGVDVPGSFVDYVNAIEAAIKAAYPGCDLDITTIDNNGQRVWASEDELTQDIKDIMADVWGEGKFWHIIPGGVTWRDLIKVDAVDLPTDLRKEAEEDSNLICYRIDRDPVNWVVWSEESHRVGIATNGPAQWADAHDALTGVNMFIQNGEEFATRN